MLFVLLVSLSICESSLALINTDQLLEEMKKGRKFSQIVDVDEIRRLIPAADYFLSIIDNMELPESDCYSRVVKKMNVNCDNATEGERELLALRFTQCYFNLTNRENEFPYNISEFDQVKNMGQDTYNIFLTLRMHVSNLCHFARQTVFNEVTSESLINLFKSVVDSSNSMHKMSFEFNESTTALYLAVENIRNQLHNGTTALGILINLMDTFQGNISTIASVIDSGIQQLEKFKFYGLVLIITFIIAFFLPEILIPIVIVTVGLFIADKALSSKFSTWETSTIRKFTKTLYLTLCSTYPIYKIVSYLYVVITSILQMTSYIPKTATIPRLSRPKPKKAIRAKPY